MLKVHQSPRFVSATAALHISGLCLMPMFISMPMHARGGCGCGVGSVLIMALVVVRMGRRVVIELRRVDIGVSELVRRANHLILHIQ